MQRYSIITEKQYNPESEQLREELTSLSESMTWKIVDQLYFPVDGIPVSQMKTIVRYGEDMCSSIDFATPFGSLALADRRDGLGAVYLLKDAYNVGKPSSVYEISIENEIVSGGPVAVAWHKPGAEEAAEQMNDEICESAIVGTRTPLTLSELEAQAENYLL